LFVPLASCIAHSKHSLHTPRSIFDVWTIKGIHVVVKFILAGLLKSLHAL
jgi:hypothetical protein